MGNLELARSYARRGWKILPCEPGDKLPCRRLVRHGVNEATSDLHTIGGWWREQPDANIGIATGQASGLFVVDVDAQSGGVETWRMLTLKFGDLKTATIRTPGGGFHLYFRLPTGLDVRNSVSRIGPGIDVRGSGGYVVAAGSKRPDGLYTWDSSSIVREAPDWLLMLIREKPLEVTEGETANGIPRGRRNQTLTSLGGTMCKRGMSVAAIEVALLAENSTRCIPPLSDIEVHAITRSVSRYATSRAAAHSRVEVRAESIQFRTAAELAATCATTPPFIVEGYVVLGGITEVVGKAKVAGKTTLLSHLVKAAVTGGLFLGRRVTQTPVVWMTEERPSTFVETLRRTGMFASSDLHILAWHDVCGMDFGDVVDAAIEKCKSVGVTSPSKSSVQRPSGYCCSARTKGRPPSVADNRRDFGVRAGTPRGTRPRGPSAGESARNTARAALKASHAPRPRRCRPPLDEGGSRQVRNFEVGCRGSSCPQNPRSPKPLTREMTPDSRCLRGKRDVHQTSDFRTLCRGLLSG
jgi:Bifunctional DNA primase/polymerase, N-terminal/Primase C terminal 1 (PriCT-1)/AAA domain